MNNPEDLHGKRKPGENAIVFDPESGDVHHSDLAAAKQTQGAALKLTDILDGDQDVLQVVSMAMRVPGTMTESDCAFRGGKSHLRVVYFESPAPRVFLCIAAGR